MPTSDNILQQVVTYQMANLAYLTNLNCFLSTANKKFKDFDKLEANLGASVDFDLPPRFVTTDTLVATFQPAVQRVHRLTADQSANTSYAFSTEQFVFNVHDYMQQFGKSATEELGARVEHNVALNCETGPYRFYGDGITQINSFGQLASALAMFRNYGAAKGNTKGYLSDIVVPNIVNSGLNQFATNRNNEMANSWELGAFSRCEWYQSNLLPIHTAGTEGETGTTLTVVSVVKDANDAVISITFSGTNAANDPNSVRLHDRFQFDDGVAGQPDMRFRTFIGHKVSANPVQFRATANAGSTAGSQVTVNIFPPLKASSGQDQNINVEIAAGMQVTVLPSHRVGMITSGDPLFLAMPRLPDQVPFPTAAKSDPETGASLRMYYGSLFGQNQQGFVHDIVWGSTVVPEYSMALIFPI